MLPLSLFAYDGTGCAGMQEEFLTSVAQIKKKLRLDMDSASVRLTAWEQKKLEVRKMLEKRADSHLSASKIEKDTADRSSAGPSETVVQPRSLCPLIFSPNSW